MNLNSNPTTQQLAALFAACTDEVNHTLWVNEDGDVHITPWPDGMTPTDFESSLSGLRFRYEAFRAGNGYVGAAAAADEKHVAEYLAYIVRDWREGLRGFSDDFAVR
jgi:hypothetical protein